MEVAGAVVVRITGGFAAAISRWTFPVLVSVLPHLVTTAAGVTVHPMNSADIEGDAIAIYGMAKQDPEEPPGLTRLVRALLGTRVEVAHLVGSRRAQLVRVKDEWRIYVRKGTPAPRMAFDCGHELAHWWMRRCGYHGDNIEQLCDALGAALVAPRPFFVAVRRRIDDVTEVAEAIGATQSLAVLREGETLGTPVALVGESVRVRGDEWGWPSEAEIRRVARTGHAALRKVKITDEPKRVALIAA